MGDIAEGLLDGTFDEWSGEYLGPGPGYPRSLDPEHPSNQRYRDPNRKMNPTFGVQHYLKNKGVIDCTPIISGYQEEVLKLPDNPEQKAICEEISKDFGAFVKWFNKSKNKK